MKRLAYLLALTAIGCGTDNPATSRLKPGQRVTVPRSNLPSGHNYVEIKAPHGEQFPEGSPAHKALSISDGDEAIVIADSDRDGDDFSARPGNRPVIIRIVKYQIQLEDVDLTGLECRAMRDELRPVERPE